MNWLQSKPITKASAVRLTTFSSIVRQLLFNRKLRTAQAARRFFEFDYATGVHDPFLLKNMRKAVNRLRQARADNETIAIYGDYDVDGVAGAAILYHACILVGFEPHVYLPDREKEGYGINTGAIDYLHKQAVTLILAVDCGTSNVTEIAYAARKGIDVVVLDHHTPPKELPKAIALINPKQPGDEYPYKELCGACVGFKFVDALSRSGIAQFEQALSQTEVKWLLDLVALATVADRVELLGENRVLVKYGLWALARRRRLGIRELLRVSGVRPRASATDPFHVAGLSTYEIGFMLAPRINAAGRMNHANAALRLLITDDESDAALMAEDLNAQNIKRQDRVKRAIADFIGSRTIDPDKQFIVHGVHARWPKGLLGLIASGMVQEYSRPAFACQRKAGAIACSARSVPSVNIIELIDKHRANMINYGGHSQAAGFTISEKKFEAFCKAVNEEIGKAVRPDQLVHEIHIDAVLNPNDITMSLYNDLMNFAPFGQGNPEPIFRINNAKIIWHRMIGAEQQHQKLRVELDNGHSYGAICFNHRHKNGGSGVRTGDIIDFVCNVNQSNWSGFPEIEFKLLDYKHHE